MRYLLICLTAFSIYAAEPAQNLSSREIHLSEIQRSRLEKDSPINDVFFDNTPNLWLLGQRALWFWQVHLSRLSHISLAEKLTKDETLVAITSLDKDFIVASSKNLYQISFRPLKITPIAAPTPGDTLALQKAPGKVRWIRSDGVFELTTTLRKISDVSIPVDAKTPQLSAYEVCYLLNQELFCTNLKSSQTRRVFKNQNKLLHFSLTERGALVHTPFALLELDHNGQVLLSIPVMGRRRLVLMEIQEDKHLFAFSDQNLEIKMLKAEKSFYSHLTIGRVEKAQLLRSRGSLVAMILDQRIRLFQLEDR